MNYVERKYILLLGQQLTNFKEVRSGLYNFRCPICGDSKKNKFKGRAYIIANKDPRFFCHNCGASYSFPSFLKQTNFSLYDQFTLENFRLISSSSIKRDKDQTNSINIKKRPSSALKQCIQLSKIDESDPLFPVKQYAIERKIPFKFFPYLYAATSLNLIAKEIPKFNNSIFPDFPVLVTPFFTWDGNFDYIQCRSIENFSNEFRFTTFEVNDNGLKIWGIPWVDWSKPIKVLEGPIDAMFVENAIALGGASNLKIIDWLLTKKKKEDICFCFDNDYKYNKEVLKFVKQRVSEGFKVLLYDKRFKWKDINKSVTDGNWTIDQINTYIPERTFGSLRAKLELSKTTKRGLK